MRGARLSPFRELDWFSGSVEAFELTSTPQPGTLVGLEAAAGCKGRLEVLVPERYAYMLDKLIHIFSRVFKPQEDIPPEQPVPPRPTFAMPEDPLMLHPAARRRVAICNLFANECKSVGEIAELLDTKTSQVISALVEEELIPDRRQLRQPVVRDRRSGPKYHLPSTCEARSNYFKALCGVVGEETVSQYIFREVIKNHERCDECCVRYSQREEDAVSASEEGYGR